jgi:membrane protease YdiL (CAAX protease family)
MNELVREHLQLILFFALFALFTNAFAWTKGFFCFSKVADEKKFAPLFLKQVLIAFAIYVGTSFFVAPVIAKMVFALPRFQSPEESALALTAMSILQLATLGLILLLLFLFALSQERVSMRSIWKDRTRVDAKPISYDFFLGMATWLLAFPAVAAVGQVCDLLIYWLFNVESYEQVAVRYLKMSLGSPTLLPVALLTILVLAPVIEEWLFRGFLQSWFKQHLGKKAAILITSLAFALFHLSASQGMGNIPLATSLFLFACYLGFLYEKQGSLFAPIGLHMAFNAVSTIRIIFMN